MRYIAALILGLWASTAAADPARWQGEWPHTDFSKTSISNWSEIISGGPPKDGIPALESAHALAGAIRVGRETEPGTVILINLSGRGDKDVETAATWFGLTGEDPPAPDDAPAHAPAEGIEA